MVSGVSLIKTDSKLSPQNTRKFGNLEMECVWLSLMVKNFILTKTALNIGKINSNIQF